MAGQIDNPGPEGSITPIGKTPTGAQDQGSNIDVMNYAKVDTGKGPSTTIASEFTCDLVKKIPSGQKTGGL